MAEPDNVLDVLTLKRRDNRPTLEMTIEEINEAVQQPTDDSGWNGYDASEFDNAERIELHMDYWDESEGSLVRVVDGQVASWDNSTSTVTIQLDRDATDRIGEYYFEWALIYDTNVTSIDNATEVNTVPVSGFYNLTVNSPTDRALGEVGAADRTVGTLTVENVIQGPDGSLPQIPGKTPSQDQDVVHYQHHRNEVGPLENKTSGLSSDGTEGDFTALRSDEVRFHTNLYSGSNPAETITETSSPKSWNFAGSEDRDIHASTDVTISNSSGASATEDITVELYDGSDTTGTLIDSETQSISVADGSSTTATFIASEAELDTGTYHIEITQSGTALSIDQADENTKGAEYTWSQNATGDLSIADQDGTPLLDFDSISGNAAVPSGNLNVGGSLSVSSDASANAFSASSNGSSGGLNVGGVINYSEYGDAARVYNSASSPSWAFRWDGSSGWTNAFEAHPSGYGCPVFENLSGQTGDFDGQVRLDDGTNTPARGTQCVWDGVNGVWRPQHDPTQSFT